MGVQGLWELLAPVGRRVSVETLAGKKLAIDASIWMVQFMKAMRDEQGEMVRNAHILGFFRRICKLLFLRTKPVFVFDGGTPALKRRTVIARRRQRENAQAKVRKTAEKLLLNHLRAMKVKELAEIKNQSPKNKDKGEKGLSNHNDSPVNNNLASSQEKLDAMLAASLATEEGSSSNINPSQSAGALRPEGGDADEETIIPAFYGKVDPVVFAALPQSMQDALIQKGDFEIKAVAKDLENHSVDKGKQVLLDHTDMLGSDSSQKDNMASRICNQEKLDEMLAASIAAEEDQSSTRNSLTSATANYSEDYVNEDEEMILPSMHGRVDPAVLAALPPSMRLDLLGQMREREMAENRQKYQKVKKAPAKFSELQVESYLKTVALRQEINQVQKSAAGRGVGGVQTSRIASEANREFIFSSSFTGNKQVLASSGLEKRLDEQQTAMEPHANFPYIVASTSKSDIVTEPSQEKAVEVVASVGGEKSRDKQQAQIEHSSTYLHKNGASTSNSDTVPGSASDKSKRKFDDVETYLDERGHIRVSRVRAMGIRMTRDLQRNLDLMKEVEHERNENKIALPESMPGGNENSIPKSLHGKHQLLETSSQGNGEFLNMNKRNEPSIFKGGTAIEICFKGDDESECFDGDDELFARLVAEDPTSISSARNMSPRKQPSESASDSDWEEGHIERGCSSFNSDANEVKPFFKEDNASNDSEVEWEEDDCDATKNTLPCYHEPGKPVSRGSLEEEADLEEAIKRSLDDLKDKQPIDGLLESKVLEDSAKEIHEGVEIPLADNLFQPSMLGASTIKQTGSLCDLMDRSENSTGVDGMIVSVPVDCPERQFNSLLALDVDMLEKPMIKQSRTLFCQPETLKDTSRCADLYSKEGQCPEKLVDASNQNSELSTLPERCSRDAPHVQYAVSGGMPHVTQIDGKRNDVEAEPSHLGQSTDHATPLVYSSMKDSIEEIDVGQTLVEETNDYNFKKVVPNEEVFPMDDTEEQVGVTEDTLEEEMLFLAQERVSLRDEQRRLERNAESVSSEMFAECQELLQIFGLPYIIAPMEAEAQCAYMELANLVEGVVTDDSDVFLFGARNVYKNIFDDRKYVETYFMKDIESELGLTREKLMRIALLLGSDYTEGISGIGIVNAIEVVNAFPEEDGLDRFREWVESPDPTILGKFVSQTESGSRKRGTKVHEKGANQDVSEAHERELPLAGIEDEKKIFMYKHRNVSKNWYIPSSFPSEAVISAYASPQVDKSTEPFSWGKPDLAVLRKLCWEKFGWGSQKADDLLLPVLKEYDKHETQLRLEAFYTFNERFAKIRSKRIKKAVKGITGNQMSELTDDARQNVSKSRKKSQVASQKSSDKEPEELPGEEKASSAKSQSKQSRKRKIGRNPSEVENSEALMLAERKASARKEPKGGDRGRGRGCGGGRGRRKGRPDFELSETSSSDLNAGEERDIHDNKLEGPKKVRKSGRSRKQVRYILDDTDNEDTSKLSDCSNKNSSSGKEAGFGGSTSAAEDACPAGSDEKEPHNSGYPSVEEGACSDYLKIGGGFCMAEGEGGEPVVSPSGGSFVEGEVSNDYLEMGGGFCIVEDEKRDTITREENADLIHHSGIMNKGVGSVQSLSSPKRAMLVNQDENRPDKADTEKNLNHRSIGSPKVGVLKDDTGTISVGVLKAMPSLRRKRRKG